MPPARHPSACRPGCRKCLDFVRVGWRQRDLGSILIVESIAKLHIDFPWIGVVRPAESLAVVEQESPVRTVQSRHRDRIPFPKRLAYGEIDRGMRSFAWRGSHLACQRLKEAVTEIKKVARKDPVTAGDGVVSLVERIWPAFQDIDTSSGGLGVGENGNNQRAAALDEIPRNQSRRTEAGIVPALRGRPIAYSVPMRPSA